MPDWIKATLTFFAVVGSAVALSLALAWVASIYGTPIAVGILATIVVVGAPTFFFVMLR